jgi:hypothetical protein
MPRNDGRHSPRLQICIGEERGGGERQIGGWHRPIHGKMPLMGARIAQPVARINAIDAC